MSRLWQSGQINDDSCRHESDNQTLLFLICYAFMTIHIILFENVKLTVVEKGFRL